MIDKNILVSAEERSRGVLSVANQRRAALLLRTRGYVILVDALSRVMTQELASAFSDVLQDCQNSAGGVDSDGETKRVSRRTRAVFFVNDCRWRIFPRLLKPFSSPELLANGFVVPILASLLGDNYYFKFVSSDTCTIGSTLQVPHRDIDFYPDQNAVGCIINVPLGECTQQNGATEVWPNGTHLWASAPFEQNQISALLSDRLRTSAEELMKCLPSEQLLLNVGDILLRDPGMWHRGTPNTTDSPRSMLTIAAFSDDYVYRLGDPTFNLDYDLYRGLDRRVGKRFDYRFDRARAAYWRMKLRRWLDHVRP
jgi:ectoine hydroxylase-related dioxygenase (phytanoyl-CoA dioxygenase family)